MQSQLRGNGSDLWRQIASLIESRGGASGDSLAGLASRLQQQFSYGPTLGADSFADFDGSAYGGSPY